MSESETIQCLNCHLGVIRRIRATYMRQFEGELIVIPDAGAWQCDVCGEFVYDDEAILYAELLLGENPLIRSPEQWQPSASGTAPQPGQDIDHKRA